MFAQANTSLEPGDPCLALLAGRSHEHQKTIVTARPWDEGLLIPLNENPFTTLHLIRNLIQSYSQHFGERTLFPVKLSGSGVSTKSTTYTGLGHDTNLHTAPEEETIFRHRGQAVLFCASTCSVYSDRNLASLL
jgi:hypothetical protein